MPALKPIADFVSGFALVRFVPKADVRERSPDDGTGSSSCLFIS